MTITNELSIVYNVSADAFVVDYQNVPVQTFHSSDKLYNVTMTLYRKFRNMGKNARSIYTSSTVGAALIKDYIDLLTKETVIVETATAPTVEEAPVLTPKQVLLSGLDDMMRFFSEFSFTPSFRFVNTLSRMKNGKEAKRYIASYFALMDNSYTADIIAKCESQEFSKILNSVLSYGKPQNEINTRFKVYYGSAGTGKTTLAQEEADNRSIVCNASMLPSDLMEDFTFVAGQPSFNPSLLWNCMEEGKPIVLDEINLLPFDSLRFLQGIVDGKTEFNYKNRPVHIKDGFCIIGTMNLTLGGVAYPLPEPLVDRCFDAREFKLTAEQLAKAIVGE